MSAAPAKPAPPAADSEMQQVVRMQAQDAVSWYFSHLNPHESHAENMLQFWRGPSLAVTLQVLAPPGATSDLPKDSATSLNDESKDKESDGADQAQDLKDSKPAAVENATAASWREYLKPTSQLTDISSSTHSQDDEYSRLPRRTKARLEAFIAGCVLAVSSDDDDAASNDDDLSRLSTRSSKRDDAAAQESISIEDALSGFQVSPDEQKQQAEKGTKASGRNGTKVNGSNGKAAPSREMNRKMNGSSSRNLSASLIPQMTSGATKKPQIPEEQLVVRLELYIRSLYRVKTLGEECVVVMEPPRSIKARARYITSSFILSAGCVRSVGPVLFKLLGYLTKELLAVEMISEDIVKVIRRVASEYEHQTSFASLAFLSSPEKAADSKLTPLVLKYLKYIQVEWEDLVQQCELESMLSRVLDGHMRRIFKTSEFQSIGHLLDVCKEFRSELHTIEISPELSNHAGFDSNFVLSSNSALKQALRDLQREVLTVNGHILPPVTSRKDLIYLLTQTLNSRSITDVPEKMNARSRRRARRKLEQEKKDGVPDVTQVASNDSDVLSTSDYDSSDAGQAPDVEQTKSKSKRHRRKFHLSTIDLLTRRLLISASRTGTGGDAYFIVRDLFGGEDVEVVPSNSIALHGRMIRPGTIDILVRLASVTIKSHASFDVYPKSLVGECEPLIQVHTTTTETIGLQEIRSGDTESSDDSIGAANQRKSSAMIVQERQTAKTGWRSIAIRPALYEKVEVWNTPS